MTTTPRRRWPARRSLALSAAGALTLALVPAGTATAQTSGARGTDRVCSDTDLDFPDIAGSAHEDNIRCLADAGITEGLNSGAYGPRGDVTRGQMATFIARFIEDHTGEDLEDGDDGRFDDVPADGYVHSDSINALAAIGVVEGTNASDGGSYAPQSDVTRGQMASFIRRALSFIDDGDVDPLTAPDAGDDAFGDDDGSVHEDNIDALAGAGIVEGFAGGDYRPGDPVKRDQMASFVMRGYDFAIAAGLRADVYETLTVEGDVVGAATEGDIVEFTVTGVESDEPYRITLVDADNIDVDADTGLVTFVKGVPADNPDARTADAGPPEARLISVNGDDVSPDPDHTIGGVEAESGPLPLPGTDTITFEAEIAGAGDDIVAVVYDDNGADAPIDGASSFLEVNAGGAPVEDFGVSAEVRSSFERLTVTETGSDGDVTSYAVDDLADGVPYRVTLVDADNVQRGDEGDVLFAIGDAADAPGTRIANAGPPDALLLDVTGADGGQTGDADDPDHTLGGILPQDGTITFDAQANDDDIVAVIYVDGGASTFLEVDADGIPEEIFGLDLGGNGGLPLPVG